MMRAFTLTERLVLLQAQRRVAETFDRIIPVLLAHPSSVADRPLSQARTNGLRAGGPLLPSPLTPREPS
jgi:hypothetical protein